jgi:hypothetical protein
MLLAMTPKQRESAPLTVEMAERGEATAAEASKPAETSNFPVQTPVSASAQTPPASGSQMPGPPLGRLMLGKPKGTC